MIAATLLYGEFTWINRISGGALTLSISPAVKHYRTTARLLREWLEMLERIGIISKLQWNGHWAVIVMSPVIGAAWNVMPEYEIEIGQEEELWNEQETIEAQS
jgi:hypothetical protein